MKRINGKRHTAWRDDKRHLPLGGYVETPIVPMSITLVASVRVEDPNVMKRTFR